MRGLAYEQTTWILSRSAERAVRLVLTGEHEHSSCWAAIKSVASKIGCTPQLLGYSMKVLDKAIQAGELIEVINDE